MKHLPSFIVLSVFSIQSILLAGEARRSTAVEGTINPESGNPVSVFLPNIAARDALHIKREEQRIEADKRGKLLEKMERYEEILEGLEGNANDLIKLLHLRFICAQLRYDFSMMKRISLKANGGEYLKALYAGPIKVFPKARANQSPISNFTALCEEIDFVARSTIDGALGTAIKAIQLTIDNLNTISANEEKKDGKSENKQDDLKSRARSYFRDLFSK